MRQPNDSFPGLSPLSGTGDLYLQAGTVSFANNATDVAIRTTLTHITSATATYSIAQSTWGAIAATDGSMSLSIDPTVTSGVAYLSRPNVAGLLTAGTDAKVSYMLIGRVYATD